MALVLVVDVEFGFEFVFAAELEAQAVENLEIDAPAALDPGTVFAEIA